MAVVGAVGSDVAGSGMSMPGISVAMGDMGG
jgi:hypothetical protein